MEDYYEYLDSNGVTTLYKLIKDDTVALIDSYSVTLNGITTNLDNHVSNVDIHTPIATIEGMIGTAINSLNYATPDYVDTKISGLVNSAPETLDTLKELSDALGSDPNFATTVANQIGTKANKDNVYTKGETDTLLEGKANSVHNHVVSDITDFPTIPTKLSQLENDMGFGTGGGSGDFSISWANITDKPNFSTVATSGSYTDLSDTPAIPTKLSQLENDTGFVNSLTDVVDTKSNQTINGVKTFTSEIYRMNNAVDRTTTPSQNLYSAFTFLDKARLLVGSIQHCQRTSGINDISFYVTGNSNVSYGVRIRSNKEFSPIENNTYSLGSSGLKWAKVYSDDVVHTSGDETIDGIKTFTNDICSKNNFADLYVTPTAYHANHNYIFADKNNVPMGRIEYCQRPTSVNDIGIFAKDKNGVDHGIHINTNNEVIPLMSSSESYSLGSASHKWSKVYSDDVVHTSGNETIAGSKTFTNQIYLGSGGTGYGLISAKDNNSILRLFGGTSPSTGANLDLYGEGLSSGGFSLRARTSDKIVGLEGKIDGTLKWNGKDIALDANVVHTSGDEYVDGNKVFRNSITVHNTLYKRNYNADVTVTPTSAVTSSFVFLDKNSKNLGYIEHIQRTSGVNDIGIYVADKNSSFHGIQITSNNEVLPVSNITYNLGSPNTKWANVYANRINCDNIVKTNETSYIYMTAGPAYNSGASIFLNGKSGDGNGTGAGAFTLYARNASAERYLLGRPDGILSWTGCIEAQEMRSTTANAFMAQCGGYTCTLRNDGSNTYLLMSAKDGTPGTWTDARPLQINNSTGVCHINGHADSANYADVATYATTQATTDNSTRIATTAWVRTYVDSVAGSSAMGSSISAYYSNDAIVTAIGTNTSNTAVYPGDFSNYVDISPKVGTIYTGSQLFSALTPTASGIIKKDYTSSGNPIYYTTAKATATFSGAFSASAKYLCTTANAVKFRAYVGLGTSNSMGEAVLTDNSISKSIFIRVQ